MSDEVSPEYEVLMEAVEDAEALHEQAKQAVCEASKREIALSQAASAARKVLVDYLIAQKPALCDEVARRVAEKRYAH